MFIVFGCSFLSAENISLRFFKGDAIVSLDFNDNISRFYGVDDTYYYNTADLQYTYSVKDNENNPFYGYKGSVLKKAYSNRIEFNVSVDRYVLVSLLHISSESKTLTFYKDTTPPAITFYADNNLVYSGDKYFSNRQVSIRYIVEDKESGLDDYYDSLHPDYYADAKGASIVNSNPKSSSATSRKKIEETDIVDSTKDYGLEIYDNVGNITKNTYHIVIDKIAPRINIVNGNINTYVKLATIVVQLSDDGGSGVSDVKYKIDNGSLLNYNGSVILSNEYSDGNHEVLFYVMDRAGNKTAASTTVKLDNTAPTAPVITNSSNGNWTAASKVTVSAHSSVDALSGVKEYYYSYDKENWKIGSSVTEQTECNKKVYFKSVDNVGNESAIVETDIKIDRTKPTKPVITNSSEGVWTTNSVVSLTASSTDKDAGISHYLFSFDKITWTNDNTVTISEECNKKVFFKSVDKCGNESEIAESIVKIDRTKPIINNIIYTSAGKILKENDLIFQSYKESKFEPIVDLEIFANDKYGTSDSGSKISYKWQVYQGAKNDKYLFETSNKFSTYGYLQDLNYITVIAIDEAGNESNEYIIPLFNDNTKPNAPIFNYSTASHKYARTIQDVTNFSDASFDFYISKNSKYGIQGFYYTLLKYNQLTNSVSLCNDELNPIDNLFIETNGSANIQFKNLDDNEENEFYKLIVKTIGNNGIHSLDSEYIFRIDTKPPENYVVYLRPQINSDLWYGSTKADLYWIEKRDSINPNEKTGVKKYEYRIIPKDWQNKDDIEYITIQNPVNSYIPIDLPGSCDVEMRFTDFAGNITNERIFTTAQIDTKAPVYEGNPPSGIFDDSNSIILSWGNFKDVDGSGVNRLEFTFTKLSKDSSDNELFTYTISDENLLNLNKNENQQIFSLGFSSNHTYLVNINCYDNVGNSKKETVIVKGEDYSELESAILSIPYEMEDRNFKFSGIADYSPINMTYSNFVGKMSLPVMVSSCNNTEIETQILNVNKSSFFDNTITEAYGEVSTEGYIVSINDEKFYTKSIGYSSENGLVFSNIEYHQSVISDNILNTKNFVFLGETGFTAYAGFLPFFSLTTLTNSIIENPVVIKENSSVFEIGGVKSLRFTNGTKVFSGNLFTESNKFDVYQKIDNKIWPEIFLQGVSSNLRNGILSAIVDCENLYITMNGLEYKINAAEINNNLLKIISAYTEVTINGNTYKLVLNDFDLDESIGTINSKNISINCYDSQNNSVDKIFDQSVSISVDSITLDSEGKLITNEAYHDFLGFISGVIIEKDSLNYSHTDISNIGFELYGFQIRANKVIPEKDDLLIESGFITIYNEDFSFENLKLNYDASKVLSDSIINGNFEKDITQKYNAASKYNNLCITQNGVTAMVTVPVNSDSGIVEWTFENVVLNSVADKGCFVEDTICRKVTYGSYNIETKKVLFDGNQILIKSGTIDLSNLKMFEDKNRLGTIDFIDLAFNYEDLIKSGDIPVSEYVYEFDNWSFYITDSLKIGKSLSASGFLYNEIENNLLILRFEDFKIYSDNTIESGVSQEKENEEDKIYIKDNYFFTINSGELIKQQDSYTLKAGNMVFAIDFDDSNSLHFSNVYITKDLKISNEYVETQTNTFISPNKYKVVTDSACLNSNGITLSGLLSSEELQAQTYFSNYEIKLMPTFVVTAKNETGTVNYKYNGWDIVGTGVNYEYQSITVNKNLIKFNNTFIEVGELKFNSDNYLYNSSICSQETDTQFLNRPGKILLSRFSDEGLNVRAEISLPDPFTGVSIVFDKIYLEPDGNFYVRSFVESKSFSVGEINFEFSDISIGSNGLIVNSLDISVGGDNPFNISLEGLVVTPNGQVLFSGRALAPFKFLGMTYIISEFSLKEDGIYFTGNTYLPSELPGVLSGMNISVNHFFINYEGNVFDLDIKATGKYSIPIGSDWAITFEKVGIEADNGSFAIVLHECGLLFPQEYNVKKVSVSDIRYDLKNKQFDFNSINIETDISLDISGIKFTLTSIKVSNDWTFGFGGIATFGKDFPPFLQDSKTDAYISFNPNKGINEIRVSVSNLNGKISDDIKILELRNGYLVVNKESDSSLIISISGGLRFTNESPVGMQNVELGITEFTYEGKNKEILKLGAYAKDFTCSIAGVTLKNLFAEVVYDKQSNGYVNLGGNVILPESMPEGIKGSEIAINRFTIGFNGKVDFEANYKNQGPFVAYGGLILSNIDIGIGFENDVPKFSLISNVLLDKNKFPSGLGGLQSTIELKLNGNGLEYGKADFSLQKGSVIFNTFTVDSFNFSFKATSTNTMEFSIENGLLVLPGENKLPKGLANSKVNIRKIRMNSKGELLDFNIGGNFTDFIIFDYVKVMNATINIQSHSVSLTNSDFEFLINGKTRLISTSLPANLRNAEFDIRTLRFSTTNGIKEFDIGLNQTVSFTILNGLDISLNKFNVSNKGFSCSAKAKMNYIGPMNGTEFNLEKLAFDWKFNILDIQGGVEKSVIKIANFTGTIEKLYFQKDSLATDGYSIVLDKCMLTLPANVGSMGGKSVGIQNAVFRNGTFLGTFIIPELEADIVGFTLKCKNPQLDYKNSKITFDSVSLAMPETFKSATVALNGVSISANNGLQFSGGKFRLPDFKISDGVGFNGLYVNFVLEGSKYTIEGEGGLSLASCGSMSAKVSFTNKSKIYPIGLKTAYFEFEASAGGIPLGTTGLKMSGIRGGLSYGPPNDVPSSMRYLFDEDGIRIQLGLTLTDVSTTGRLVYMTPTTWIDVKNYSFAFSGQLCVLKGTFDLSANAAAGLSKYGFYTGLTFTLKVVKGEIEFYIFDQNGVKFSGRGSCQFGIQKGALLSKTIKILWKKVSVNIPTSDIWLAKVGTEFGYFGSAGTGFKAYTSFAGFGNFGIFVGSKNNIKIGNVNSYTLVTPKPTEMIRGGLANLNNINNFSLNKNVFSSTGAINLNTLSYSYDDTFQNSKTHSFLINPKSNPGISIGLNNNRMKKTLSKQRIDVSEKDSGLDRIIFVCSYLEGNPELCAISPSGKSYSTTDENVETTYYENCITFIVYEPEAGNWEISVENIDEDTYYIDLLTVEADNTVTVLEPSWNKKKAEDTIYVKGSAIRANSIVHVYATESKDSPLFELGTLITDDNAIYEGYISTNNIFDGEYYIVVKGESSMGELSQESFSPGTYLVDRSNLKLLPPANFLISEKKQNTEINGLEFYSLSSIWNNPNGNRTAGYKLQIIENDEIKEYDLGNITSYVLSNLEAGTDLQISICAYDENGLISDYTEPQHIIINSDKMNVNKPVVINNDIKINAIIGDVINTSIKAKIEDFIQTNSIQDYINGKVLEINTGDVSTNCFIVSLDNFIKIQSDEIAIPLNINVFDDCPVGNYQIRAILNNEGNENLSSEFLIELNVQYPNLQIDSIMPEQIDGSLDSQLYVYGSGFVDGARFYFDDKEITVNTDESNSLTQKCLNIPACNTSGQKELKIINPNGEEIKYLVDVIYPDWDVYSLIDSVKIRPGDFAIVPVNIESMYGYNGVVALETITVPVGMYITIPNLSLDTISNIKIETSSDIAAGDYTIVLAANNGKKLSLLVTIEDFDEEEIPNIVQIAPYSAFEGEQVTIYGSGFGNTGHLIFDKTEVATDEWTSTSISFTVTPEMKTGLLYVVKDDVYSNATRLIIHERGFTIKSNQSDVALKRNSSVTIPLYINGYAKSVSMELNVNPSAPLKTELSEQVVIPNGITNLIISGNADAENGFWDIVVNGVADSFIATKTIRVTIEDSMTLDTSEIYKGKVGVPYKAQLYTKNSEGVVEYNIISGKLPTGLTLTSKGTILGIPTEECLTSVTLSAKDTDGQFLEKTVEFEILDDSWILPEKNTGYSRSSTSEMPSTDSTAWTVSTAIENSNLIISEQKIYSYNNSIIKAYDDNGRLLWKLNERIKKVQSTSSNILLLTESNNLYALDKKYGNAFWYRTGVFDFTSSENIIVTKEKSGFVCLSIKDGVAILIDEVPTINFENIIWVGNRLFEVSESRLSCVYGYNQSVTLDSSILRVSADSDGFVIVTKNTIYVLDSGLNIKASLACASNDNTQIQTGLDSYGIFINNSGHLTEFNRDTLEPVWSISNINHFAIANEKAIVINEEEIAVINRYNGKRIWNKEGCYCSLALYGENIYAQTITGDLYRFNGIPNATAPNTTVKVLPEKPNGTQDWYNITPTVSVVSEDIETYVNTLLVSYDNSEWSEYKGSKQISDGYSIISAYGIDSKGYRGEPSSISIKVDTVKPVSQFSISHNSPINEWISEDVSIELSAYDELSGLSSIICNDKDYSTVFTISDEGIHHIKWYAVDNAGNKEDVHNFDVMIDKYIPNTGINVKYANGIAIVYLTAEDSGSGIDRIEYSVNGNNRAVYTEPVVLLKEGLNNFVWEAFDISGKSSGIKTSNIRVSKNTSSSSSLALPELNGKLQNVGYPLDYGSMLIKNDFKNWSEVPSDFWQKAYSTTLPEFVLKGDFILWNGSDMNVSGTREISWYIKKDSVIYIFADKKMKLDKSWFLINSNSHIQDSVHPEGFNLYMRRGTSGEKISVILQNNIKDLPLIVVKPINPIQTEIKLVRNSAWDDIYYNGRKPYRGGVQVVLSSILTPQNLENSIPVTQSWTYEMDEIERPLSSLWFTLPDVTKPTEITFRFKIISVDGIIESISEKTILIEAQDNPENLYPWNKH